MFNDRTLRHDTKENRIFWSPRPSQITPGWKKTLAGEVHDRLLSIYMRSIR